MTNKTIKTIQYKEQHKDCLSYLGHITTKIINDVLNDNELLLFSNYVYIRYNKAPVKGLCFKFKGTYILTILSCIVHHWCFACNT